MAKFNKKNVQHETGKTITTKSWFGSTSDMVVDADKFDVELNADEVLCNDGDHYYITKVNRLDSGLADPARQSLVRTVPINESPLTEEGDE